LLQHRLFLVSKNVPFDVAFSLPEHEALAYMVILAGFEGAKFDFDTLSWERRTP
jgi:hypothetical protein